MEAPQQQAPERTSPTTEDDVDAAMDAALSKVSENQGISAKEAAAREEQIMAERIAGANAAARNAEKEKPPEPASEDEPQDLGSIASRGRDYLMQRMREHQEALQNIPPYVPPPVSPQMQERINEELEAGRRTAAKHAAARAAQLPPDKNELERKAEGTNTPVFRPDNMVPDPKVVGTGREGLRPQRK